MRSVVATVALCLYARQAHASGPDGGITMLFGVLGMLGVDLALVGTLVRRRTDQAFALHVARVLAFLAAGFFVVSLPDAYAVWRLGYEGELVMTFGVLSLTAAGLIAANLRQR